MEKLLILCKELSANVRISYRPDFAAWEIHVWREYLGKKYGYSNMFSESRMRASKNDVIDELLNDIRSRLSNEYLCKVHLQQTALAEYGLE